MGQRIAIGGYQNSGKSYGRRYIPDGENVMIIQPSVKTGHLFTGPDGVDKFTPEQIDKAITDGKRKPVKPFNIVSPEGKYSSTEEALALIPDGKPKTLTFSLTLINDKKSDDYFGGPEGRKYLQGNVIHCSNLDDLKFYVDFVNRWMPWIHTIILPDFTHYISEVLTSPVFIGRKVGGEQYAKYLDLAAVALNGFIKSSDTLRSEMIVVTEYHVELIQETNQYEIFLPGGKMFKEKLLPSSYYDTFLFTDTKFDEDDEGKVEYNFVTRKTKRYPEARSIGGFTELRIPNNWQEVLNSVRKYNGIELPISKKK